jgi:hypothetical protein
MLHVPAMGTSTPSTIRVAVVSWVVSDMTLLSSGTHSITRNTTDRVDIPVGPFAV